MLLSTEYRKSTTYSIPLTLIMIVMFFNRIAVPDIEMLLLLGISNQCDLDDFHGT